MIPQELTLGDHLLSWLLAFLQLDIPLGIQGVHEALGLAADCPADVVPAGPNIEEECARGEFALVVGLGFVLAGTAGTA